MKTTTAARFSVCGLAAAFAIALPLNASAGLLRINFAEAFDFGEDWTGAFDDELDLSLAGSVFQSDLAPGGVPFSLGTAAGPSFATTPFADGLDIGGTTYTSFCVSKNGAVGLGSGSSPCSLDPTTSPLFSVLGGDWNYLFGPGAPAPSSISVALGLVDRDFDGVYDAANAVPALRFFWNGMVDGPQPPPGSDPPLDGLEFQAIFFDLGGGDFDVEFNYRSLYANGIQRVSTPDGSGGFTTSFFGIDADRLGGLADDPFFQFRDGVFSLSSAAPPPPPTSVPEPGTLWLLVAGAAAVLLLLRRSGSRASRRTLPAAVTFAVAVHT